MSNDMGLVPVDLEGLPGSPFTQAEIDAAVAALRSAAGWHIAPERTDTIELDVECMECTLRLPTKKLVAVVEITDTELDTVIASSTYRVSTEKNAVHKRGYGWWPHGYARLEVEFTHGYTTVPADLLPLFAEAMSTARRDQTANTFGAGPFSVSYGGQDITNRTLNPLSTAAVLERYSLFQMGMA
jgi:hypothetical protein